MNPEVLRIAFHGIVAVYFVALFVFVVGLLFDGLRSARFGKPAPVAKPVRKTVVAKVTIKPARDSGSFNEFFPSRV